jgi:mRNA interferase RelE/StbE
VSWTYKFDERALKELRKLGRQTQIEILDYLDTRIAGVEDPRRFGKPLRGELAGLWRYRVRDCRIVCHLRDQEFVVLVLRVGHRRDIYE